MGVFGRISDIISANLNEWTDQFEDPEKMLKQAVREMEASISEVTQQAAKAMANQKTLSRERERNRQQAAEWQARAETAVEAGDDDLARKALTRKREHDNLTAALEDQIDSTQEAAVTLRRPVGRDESQAGRGQAEPECPFDPQTRGRLPNARRNPGRRDDSRGRRNGVRQVRAVESQGRAGRGGSRGDGGIADRGRGSLEAERGGPPRGRPRRRGVLGRAQEETEKVRACIISFMTEVESPWPTSPLSTVHCVP